MIVTQAILLDVGGCATIVQHLVDIGYDGLTRLAFVQKMQNDANADKHPQWWVSWAKKYLYNGNAIVKFCEFTKTGRYAISGLNVPVEYPIFTDLTDAVIAMKQKQTEQIEAEAWMFHVHAKCPQGEDAHTLHNCDLDGDGVLDHPVDCYHVFNHLTGIYEEFAIFEKAKAVCDALRVARVALVCSSYRVTEEVQQINDPEENPAGWVEVDVGTARA